MRRRTGMVRTTNGSNSSVMASGRKTNMERKPSRTCGALLAQPSSISGSSSVKASGPWPAMISDSPCAARECQLRANREGGRERDVPVLRRPAPH